MYSPNFRSDSPLMSPMAFHLDDPNNKNNIQSLLLSPTKVSLDSVNGASVYRTSLSKLNELTRTGRGRERRGSDILRSSSPIKFPSVSNAAPKMLKPEYMGTHGAAIPLLSAIMKQSSKPTEHTNNENTNKPVAPEPVENRKLNTSIFAQLQESFIKFNIQGEQVPAKTTQDVDVNHNQEEVLEIPKKVKNNKHAIVSENALRKISNTESSLSGSTMHETDSISEKESLKLNHSTNEKESSISISKIPVKKTNVESNARNETDIQEIPNDINVDLLPTDRNGFVQLNNHKNNRYSFISSASTDFEIDWYNQLQQQSNLQLSQPSPRFPSQSESDDSARNEVRIKKLEVEINDLKLQNEKLIQTFVSENEKMRQISTSQMATTSITVRAKKPEKDKRQLRNKVKRLEKKLENYKKAMNKLVEMNAHAAYMRSPATEHDEISSVKTRISRISDKDLKQIEDAKSSSDTPTSELDEEDEDFSDSFDNLAEIKELADMTYTSETGFPIEENYVKYPYEQHHLSESQSKRSSMVGGKRKVGFQLNLQIEK